MSGWGWISKGANVGKDAYKLNEASKALNDACQALGQHSNPTPEQRAAVQDAFKDWSKAAAQAGGDAALGLPVPMADRALGGLIENLQESPAMGFPGITRAQEYLEKNGVGEKARAERNLCRNTGHKFDEAKNAPPPRRDPLAIDLDGDGIETVSAIEGISFDHDGNGVKSGTGWVKRDDGFLVMDRNGNGLIDNGSELFGVDTILRNNQKASDGFQALAEHDANSDGVIDAGDAVFQDLKVWRDIDQDGVSQSDELFSLAELGITSFNLTKTVAVQDLGNGNLISASGSYTRSGGATAAVVNLDLSEDLLNNEFVESIALSPAVKALPSMTGLGLVRDLSQAAMLSSTVLSVLTQYAAANTVYEQKAMVGQLISAWATTASIPSLGVAYEFTGIQRYLNDDPAAGETSAYKSMLGKLHVLEIFNARSFAAPGVTNPTLRTDQIALINESYDALESGVFESLITQTLLKPYFDAIMFVEDNAIPYLDYTGMLTLLDQKIATNPSAGIAEVAVLYHQSGGFFANNGWDIVAYFERAISAHPVDANLTALLTSYGITAGGAGNDSLATSATLTTAFGGGGNDSISGGAESAVLYGGDGNDTITDQNGSDTLAGGNGDDVINDQGSGNNILRGEGGNDTINFSFQANNAVDGGAGNDLLQMPGYSSNSSSAYSNTITGGAGNDRIISGSSADTYRFNRGDGQDLITDYAAWANTTPDVLVFGTGITQDNLVVSRSGNNLVIKVNDPNNAAATDQIAIDGWFSNSAYQIESLQFADNTSLTAAQLSAAATTVFGTDNADTLSGFTENNTLYGFAGNDNITDPNGNDTIDGGAGDDIIIDQGSGSNILRGGDGNDTVTFQYTSSNTLEGGAGNDTIQVNSTSYNSAAYSNTFNGGLGNDRLVSSSSADTYLFNRGDGQDTISDYDYAGNSTTDKLMLGSGIAVADVTVSRSGSNLVINIADPANPAATDRITIENWFVSTNYQIESLLFNDGTTLTKAQLTEMGNTVYGTAGADVMTGASDSGTMMGLAGNDSITDSGGNDTIDGGAGDDTITDQGSGSNTLRGGDGNDTVTFSYNSGNTLEGGAGNDTIKVNSTNYNSAAYSNTFNGGQGNDRLVSANSADTYLFSRGDGQDTISDYDYAGNSTSDKLMLGSGIAVGDVTASRSGSNLVINIADPANPAANDRITVENWFVSTNYQIESLVFNDGTTLTKAQLTEMGNTVYGTAGADTMTGQSDSGTILGLAGNDNITDSGGNDTIDGGAGDDIITDQNSGTNTLRGGDGNDNVTFSYNSSNTLEGGAGNDTIKVNSTNYNSAAYSNTFNGGQGNDRLVSANSADTYLFSRGDGQDTISDFDYAGTSTNDKLLLGSGIAVGDVTVSRSGSNLVINIADPANPAATDRVTVENWFASTNYQIESLVFTDGTTLTKAQLTEMGNTIYGTAGADTLAGTSDNNTILGLAGNDSITDSGGNDTIDGGTGDDIITDQGSGSNTLRGGDGNDTVTFSYTSSNTLAGGAGNDLIQMAAYNSYNSSSYSNTFTGGTGNDRIVSGGSADTYLFNRGDGQDLITDFDVASSGKTDTLVFGADITSSQIWLQHKGNNLEISVIGSGETVTVENWYVNGSYQIEQLKSGDGKVLSHTQVESLVQAMAAFAPPAAGQTDLPQNYQDALAQLIGSSWVVMG